jgi:cytochrome P450
LLITTHCHDVHDARRETTAPTCIGPYKVPEGIVVWPMIYGLQNSTHNWDNPHLFQPVSSAPGGLTGS